MLSPLLVKDQDPGPPWGGLSVEGSPLTLSSTLKGGEVVGRVEGHKSSATRVHGNIYDMSYGVVLT
jgi:hypothetical protein